MRIHRQLCVLLGLWVVTMSWAVMDRATAQSPVRVIAVQPKIDLTNADTYAHYRDHIMGLVQTQVQPRLAAGRPNLVVFPEDVGLPAAFIGSRTATARRLPCLARTPAYSPEIRRLMASRSSTIIR